MENIEQLKKLLKEQIIVAKFQYDALVTQENNKAKELEAVSNKRNNAYYLYNNLQIALEALEKAQ